MLIWLGLSILFGLMLAAIVYLTLRQKQQSGEGEALSRVLLDLQKEIGGLQTKLNDQILGISQQMNSQIEKNTQFLQSAHKGYTQAVGDVQHRLGELHGATKSMVDIGRDIASLQDILRTPKLRGGLGELFLEELLKQILPEDHFSLQYGFKSGTKVDAVIMLGQGLIPVDAKFPLENFKRVMDAEQPDGEKQARKAFIQDVKKHIDDIQKKYILPEEGTFDFALMYIPAENVYYETIIKSEGQSETLAAYALNKRVIPVSPNSFYAYLQAIARGLKGLRIERSAQIILENLGQLETDFAKCLTEFEKVGSHLGNAQTAYDKVTKRFSKLHNKLLSTQTREDKALPEEKTPLQTS